MSRIAILGGNFTTILGITRVLGRQGYEIAVIRTAVYTGNNYLKKIHFQ